MKWLWILVVGMALTAVSASAYDTKADCFWDPNLSRQMTPSQVYQYCNRLDFRGGDAQGSPTAPQGGIPDGGSRQLERDNINPLNYCAAYRRDIEKYRACIQVLTR